MLDASFSIALDAMGGDIGASVNVAGAIAAAKVGGFKVFLVGDESLLEQEVKKNPLHGADIEIVHAPETVGMDEKPSVVLRRYKNSSMQVAFRLVKEGRAKGVVTAGNSGAAMACGMFILGRIKGVDRPALASIMPSEKNPFVLLDAGANTECKPVNLLQFGYMGSVLAQTILRCENPRISLLSNGEEPSKGSQLIQKAHQILKQSSLNFIGNIEGRGVFAGETDVVVCDGFTGNVVLKLAEGMGVSFAHLIKAELSRNIWGKMGSFLALGAFRRFKAKVDYAEYGGAPILGLSNIAFVCHGASNVRAIKNALLQAGKFVQHGATEQLIQHFTTQATALEESENLVNF